MRHPTERPEQRPAESGSSFPAAPRIASDAKAIDLTRKLFDHRYLAITRSTDRLLAKLLVVQWVLSIALVLFISPSAWADSGVSSHLGVVFGLGTLITAVPIVLAWRRPGRLATRHAIACAQVLWSALFIHLTQGRTESHFHVFVSLALLAFYRDPRLLVAPTAIVFVDHFLRGLLWPESIYGAFDSSWWRLLERTGWVLLAAGFLVSNCRRGRRELWGLCREQIELQASQRETETRRRFLEDMVASIDHALFIVRGDGRVAQANAAAARLLGMDVDKIAGMRAPVLGLAARDTTDHPSPLSLGDSCVTLKASDGTMRPASIHVTAIDDGLGLEGAWLVSARDMSDVEHRMAAESSAREADTRRNELQSAYDELENTNRRLSEAQSALIDASRRAGIAQHATNVLHNVGNVLNSVNVAATVVETHVSRSPALRLAKLASLLEDNRNDLPTYFSDSERAGHFVAYVSALQRTLESANDRLRDELRSVRSNVEHIRSIVAEQQNCARRETIVELVDPADLVQCAIDVCETSATAHDVVIRSDIQADVFRCDRHRALQILINLLSNAQQAFTDAETDPKVIDVSVRSDGEGNVVFEVTDNGAGMSPSTLERLFEHGFTTKATGSGFGLHSSATAAVEIGGSLRGTSSGIGLGSTFLLAIPEKPDPQARRLASFGALGRDAA